MCAHVCIHLHLLKLYICMYVCMYVLAQHPRYEHLANDYHIFELTTRPRDLGYHAVSRERNYFLLVHRKKGCFIGDPRQVYKAIAERLETSQEVTIDALFWERDENELRQEALASMTPNRAKGIEKTHEDWSQYLTEWEQKGLKEYSKQWLKRHGNFKDAVFVLNQNPEHHKTQSNNNGADEAYLPTLSLAFDTEYICLYSVFS